MRRIAGILLASTFLFSSTELHQLFHIPVFMKHYKEHCMIDRSMNLFSFLKLHYGSGHPLDNDDKDDQELPFKSPADVIHIDNAIYQPIILSVALSVLIRDKGFQEYREVGLPSLAFAIFHPPRLC